MGGGSLRQTRETYCLPQSQQFIGVEAWLAIHSSGEAARNSFGAEHSIKLTELLSRNEVRIRDADPIEEPGERVADETGRAAILYGRERFGKRADGCNILYLRQFPHSLAVLPRRPGDVDR